MHRNKSGFGQKRLVCLQVPDGSEADVAASAAPDPEQTFAALNDAANLGQWMTRPSHAIFDVPN